MLKVKTYNLKVSCFFQLKQPNRYILLISVATCITLAAFLVKNLCQKSSVWSLYAYLGTIFFKILLSKWSRKMCSVICFFFTLYNYLIILFWLPNTYSLFKQFVLDWKLDAKVEAEHDDQIDVAATAIMIIVIMNKRL